MAERDQFLVEGDHLIKVGVYISFLGTLLILEFLSQLNCDDMQTVFKFICQCISDSIGRCFISDLNKESFGESTPNELLHIAILLSPLGIFLRILGNS